MQSPIIVALDFSKETPLLALTDQLDPKRCRLKIGKEAFTRFGPELVKKLQSQGFDIFLDLKFHDIPNTVAKACQAAADLGVWMLNVHCLGGTKMMEAAAKAIDAYKEQKPRLIGVTILTSHQPNDLHELGLSEDIKAQVAHLANLAKQSGLDGVVSSAHEATTLRKNWHNADIVTPGVRMPKGKQDDQSRIMTPKEAMEQGASHLVIGRPITQAENPMAALEAIENNLQ